MAHLSPDGGNVPRRSGGNPGSVLTPGFQAPFVVPRKALPLFPGKRSIVVARGRHPAEVFTSG